MDVRQAEEMKVGEAEKAFYEDTFSRSAVARSVRSQITRPRSSRNKLRTPFDFLSKEEKKRYLQGGEVKVSNIYEDLKTLVDFSHFKLLFKDDRKKVLEKYLNFHTPRKIAEYWGIDVQKLFDLRYRLGIPAKKYDQEDKGDNIMEHIENLDTTISEITGIGDFDNVTEETAIPYEQFMALEKKHRYIVLKKYMDKFGMRKLSEIWKVKYHNVYDKAKSLGVIKVDEKMSQARAMAHKKSKAQKEEVKPKETHSNANNDMANVLTVINKMQTFMEESKAMFEALNNQKQNEQSDMEKNITKFQIKGMKSGDEISERILKIGDSVIKEKKYNVSIVAIIEELD